MRRRTALIASATLVGGLLVLPNAALAEPLPPEDRMKSLLLTTEEMVKATGYSGTLVSPPDSPSCYDTDDGGRDCMAAPAPQDFNNPQNYPYLVYISGFPTVAANNKHFREHVLNPKPFNNETIKIVSKNSRRITYTSVPADPTMMASAWTSIRGKQGLISGACAANTTSPDLKALAECSVKLANAQLKKVKNTRPKTPLA